MIQLKTPAHGPTNSTMVSINPRILKLTFDSHAIFKISTTGITEVGISHWRLSWAGTAAATAQYFRLQPLVHGMERSGLHTVDRWDFKAERLQRCRRKLGWPWTGRKRSPYRPRRQYLLLPSSTLLVHRSADTSTRGDLKIGGLVMPDRTPESSPDGR